MAADLKQSPLSQELDTDIDLPVIENIIIAYLQGLRRERAVFNLRDAARNRGKSCKDLCKKIKVRLRNGQVNPPVKAILANLRITEDSGELYGQCIAQKDLYALLAFLAKQPDSAISEQIKDIKSLINKAKTPIQWGQYLFVSSLLSIGSILFFHYRPDYFHDVVNWFNKSLPEVWEWLETKLSILKNAAVVGMGVQSFLLLYEVKQVLWNDAITKRRKAYEILVRSVQYGLSIAGYAVMFIAAGVMTPLSMALFISGAFISTVSGVFIHYCSCLWKKGEIVLEPSYADEPKFEVHAEHIRRKAYAERDEKAVWLEARTAALAAVVIVLWCIIPPSIPVSFGCMLANVLIMGLNRIWLSQNKRDCAVNLQSKLDHCKRRLLMQHKRSQVIAPSLVGDAVGIEFTEQISQLESQNHQQQLEIERLKNDNRAQASTIAKLRALLKQSEAPNEPQVTQKVEQLVANNQENGLSRVTVIEATERFSPSPSSDVKSITQSKPGGGNGILSYFWSSANDKKEERPQPSPLQNQGLSSANSSPNS